MKHEEIISNVFQKEYYRHVKVALILVHIRAMRYFVFDLDETLVEIYPVSYFIASLRVMVDEDRAHLLYIPKTFHQSLEKAYRFFVRAVLDAEQSPTPLGLLRPGILKVMKELQRMREENVIDGVMIYSNNPNLQSLEFVADIIHEHVRSKHLIRECIHFHHALRQEERYRHTRLITKTWEGVKHSLVHGTNTHAPHSISPSDIYFFDDLDHMDLQNELGDHYVKVPPYRYHASFTRLSEMYHKAIVDAGVDQELFVTVVCDLLHLRIPRYITEQPTLDDMINWFRLLLDVDSIGYTPVSEPPMDDEGIMRMWHVIHSIRPPSMRMRRQRKRKHITRKARRRTVRK